jgi:hypothetical protein
VGAGTSVILGDNGLVRRDGAENAKQVFFHCRAATIFSLPLLAIQLDACNRGIEPLLMLS